MTEITPSPLNNVITIDDERIKSHLDRVVRGSVEETLNALLDAGIAVNYACTEGVCGTCETRVIEGTPDHRDQFLSKEEQAANKTIMICCSGARSRTLVLDI